MCLIARRTGALAICLLIMAIGCGGQPSDEPRDVIQLTPDRKAPNDDRFLTWGTAVTIAGMPRTVLSASKPVTPPPDITQDTGQRRVGFSIPAEFKAAGWIILEEVANREGTTAPVRTWPVANSQAGRTYSVAVHDARSGPGSTPGVRLYPVPDLATRDVDTAEITVPEHAVLQVGMGLEPASWDSTVLPLDMTISTIANGTATVLRTTRIDIHRPEHRQWIDLSIPLDALAGHTVRFRFSTRAAIGPTAVPSLPVWAEPTIIDTHLLGN